MIPTSFAVARDLRIDIDPDVARRNKLRRDRRFNTVVVPSLRLAGLLLLPLLIALHGWLVPESVSPGSILTLTVVVVGYAAGSWTVLRHHYVAERRLDLGVAFLTIDLGLIAYAIYLSGGPASWLFPLLLARVADQGHTTMARTAFFGVASVLSYVAMLGYVAVVDGHVVTWRVEILKLTVMSLFNVYMILAARTAERIRRRTAGVLTLATSLVQRLEVQSAELRESMRRADEASRAKDEFLARMSHELRTPLNAIIGLSSILADSRLDDEQRDSITTVQAAGNHLLALISDVLDFSRIEAGRLSIERVPLDLDAVLDQTVRQLRVGASAKGITLELAVDAGVPRRVLGDPLRLAQILLNLGANAVKFTEQGRVTLRVTTCPVAGEGVGVQFDVVDTGIGIPEEARASIFEAFMQADVSTTRRYGGAGLGLAISQGLVELMGGRITFESRDGFGSTFTVQLPFAIEPAAAGVAPPRMGTARPDAMPPRVLVAEDNPVNRKVAEKLLRRIGCEVVAVPDGIAAIEALSQSEFTVVLMDCQMPGLDGFEATARIRAGERDGRRLPVIALTANATTEVRQRCFESGMDDYVAKPVRIDELRAVIEKWAA